MITLPGLIDLHVHLRDFNESNREDFLTGTKAALAGGYTTIFDMPNNNPPITSYSLLKNKLTQASGQIVCDTGFYFGTLGDNMSEFPKIQSMVVGLKVYLNQTTGNYLIDLNAFQRICNSWPADKLIFIHAEEEILERALAIAKKSGNKVHVGHISSQKELDIVLKAKHSGMAITCGVTPHHLFLTQEDEKKLGSFARMKPSLKTKKDQKYLWDHLDDIDCIESDHAPQTISDKQSPNPPFGVAGLETTLPLLLTAMSKGKITIEQIKRLCHDNPGMIAHVPNESDTYIEIDETQEWTIKNEDLFTKCQWSPFNNWPVKGKIKKAVLRGKTVFATDNIVAKKGTGKIITY